MNSFKDFKIAVPLLGGGQKNFQQCWYASYRSLYTYHKQPADSIDGKLAGNGIDVADAKANGLVDTKFHAAGEALGMTMWSGEKFKQAASWYDVDLTDGCEAFIDELVKGPLWVSRFIESGTYHIVLATGFKWGDSGKGYIIYNNPFPGPSDAVEVSTLVANVFVRHITSARGSVQAFR
jgi:papain like cysteine protease AvrRpt2